MGSRGETVIELMDAIIGDHGQLVALFNPRTQDWSEHFVLDGLRIRGMTPVGRATVHTLNMNHPSQIDARRFFINTGRW